MSTAAQIAARRAIAQRRIQAQADARRAADPVSNGEMVRRVTAWLALPDSQKTKANFSSEVASYYTRYAPESQTVKRWNLHHIGTKPFEYFTPATTSLLLRAWNDGGRLGIRPIVPGEKWYNTPKGLAFAAFGTLAVVAAAPTISAYISDVVAAPGNAAAQEVASTVAEKTVTTIAEKSAPTLFEKVTQAVVQTAAKVAPATTTATGPAPSLFETIVSGTLGASKTAAAVASSAGAVAKVTGLAKAAPAPPPSPVVTSLPAPATVVARAQPGGAGVLLAAAAAAAAILIN